jgi:Flp pilus assembly protein TadG
MQRLRRLFGDARGLAALEFAIIAPMMVLVLFGTVELTQALATNRRAENVAASIADIVARDTIIDDAEMDDLWFAINALMFPDTPTNMKMRVTSVTFDASGAATAHWSEGHNGWAPFAAGASVPIPTGMRIPDTSLIMTQTSYRYTPPIGVFLKVAFDLEHTEYRRPRVADPVERD